MRNISRGLRTVAVMIVSAVLLALIATPAQAATATGSISGVVTESATGAPVAGARVYANEAANLSDDGPSALTDASGAYTITGLTPGTYVPHFESPRGSALAWEFWKSTFDPDKALPVVVASGAAVSGVDAALKQATSSISGHISVPAGFDVRRVYVRVYEADQPRYTAGYPTGSSVSADGTWTIHGLPADDYRVFFADVDSKLTRVWWNSTSTFDDAGIVSVADGQIATGIDASLDTGSTISGRVAGGRVSAGFGRAYVYRAAGDGPVAEADLDREVPIAKDGTFTVTGLAPGTYKLAYQDQEGCASASASYDTWQHVAWANRRFWWSDQSGPLKATTITLGDHQHVAGLTDDLDVLGGHRSTASGSGATVVGQTLRVNPGAWDPGTPIIYYWMADDEPISGATGATFTVTPAQAGRTISVWVLGQTGGPSMQFCDGAWERQDAVFPTKVMTVSTPTITGTRAVGFTVAVNRGTWTSGTAFAYAWYANGTYIPGSVGRTSIKLASAQKGKTLSVQVTGKKSGYPTVSRTSARTAKVALTAVPTISGVTTVGHRLTAHPGTWTTGTHFTYAWYADGVYIPGSVGHTTWLLAKAQGEKEIRVKVTGQLAGYQTIARMSAPTAWIARW